MILVLEAEEQEERYDLTDEEEAEDEDRVESQVVGLEVLQDGDVRCLDEVEDQPVGV